MEWISVTIGHSVCLLGVVCVWVVLFFGAMMHKGDGVQQHEIGQGRHERCCEAFRRHASSRNLRCERVGKTYIANVNIKFVCA